MLFRNIFPILLYCIFADVQVQAQRTALDTNLGGFVSLLRPLILNVMGRSGDVPSNVALHRRRGKTQHSDKRARSAKEFCDVNGPGKRSPEPPTSVHRLRPGDIDIIAAMGDSLTAGNGVIATNLMQVIHENRGVVWSIGGQGNWRQYLTIPNLLKEYNPNLYGYSLKDGLGRDRTSRFNVAELGAMSRDMPYMAKVLVARLSHDPNVNMTHHWKLITMLIGNNDFCSDVCYLADPMKSIDYHEQNMLKTYRYLRDNVPRLMLNVVPAPNLLLLTKLKGLPPQCHITLPFECPCLIGKSRKRLEYMNKLMEKWIQKDYEIANRAEFNSETFTINIEHFTKDFVFPKLPNGNTDTSYSSEDCFHISQKGHAASANSYWNNLFEMPNNKSSFTKDIYDNFVCPTEEHPYIITRVNSRKDFRK
ncbi:phospholipase B1, membrane-associated [Musca domestica]|uniref:Phospholipase B1, membrane-associated n=1 Tax=Musca domestica TaxID=7370 RepID=A0A9J7CL43_MUSDO|nr:phospholipase B1, membrane-associated [Musca domestica]